MRVTDAHVSTTRQLDVGFIFSDNPKPYQRSWPAFGAKQQRGSETCVVHKFYFLVLLSIGLLLISGYSERVQAREGFTEASIRGTYASTNVGEGGQVPEAGFGIYIFDGNGNFTGVTTQNQPGPSLGERILLNPSFAGTYRVNKDGTGVTTTTITLPDGTTNEENTVFVITHSSESHGFKIAEAFTWVVKNLSATTGSLETAVLTRLPDEGEFTNASLKGTYASINIGQGGLASEAGIAIATFDGNGNSVGTFAQNLPGPSFKERIIFKGNSEGRYTVNRDGTGTFISATNSATDFVVTKAKVINGVKVAEEIFSVSRDLSPVTGNLVTIINTRISD